ncbi:hypothetical protein [Okeania sp. KiyG1]|uniref:hypothetical protein n=1 Tax=Okeania sp. KiyG1 TaxID=2720165 RepID=UPI0019211428|nr:hypothetical protein [Okeania sp. KiyG1]GFZ90540.1 hypothetical protein CYANOKiyG1_00830 [Okeania sp. KiyG1]
MPRKEFNPLFSIDEVKQLAIHQNVNVSEVDNLLDEMEKIYIFSFSEKSKMMIYLAMTGLFTETDVAKITQHNPRDIKPNFSKQVSEHFKNHYSDIQSDKKVFGIASLRRTLFSLHPKCFYQNNDDDSIKILHNRIEENLKAGEGLKVEENIHDSHNLAN